VIEAPEESEADDLITTERPVQIWAHLGIPGEAQAFLSSGEIVAFDGRRPVMEVCKLKGLRSGSPDYQEIAERIVQCVNFCAGVDLSEIGYANLLDFITSQSNSQHAVMRSALNDYFATQKGGATRDSKRPSKAGSTRRRQKQSN
jgi:hypothetical protein